MKDYKKELADMQVEFNALCKKYNRTGVAVVSEGKSQYFLASVNSNEKKELVELVARGFDFLVSAMFTLYGNERIKEARNYLGTALNNKYVQRLNMMDKSSRISTVRDDGRIKGKVLKYLSGHKLVFIVGTDKKTYAGHWDEEEKGKLKRSKSVYFYPGEPETLSDGTVSKYPTALDVKRVSELPEVTNG